ncbi:cytokine receptor family member B16 [Cheilinus undulatus]|uniref:cytokine receptor family member B16 n=1 Tax=Cheilinus undulatus TaxID=241271 RepID=UPI001BD2C441|nr:cytokine receptor family member B16 [Cheilinus undulatus]
MSLGLQVMLMMTALLDFTNCVKFGGGNSEKASVCGPEAQRDVWTLPAPSGVTMDSVNMKHILKWRPLQALCDTAVLYSVQFQGEFELTVLNDSWVDALECQLTPHTACDLTYDLGSDSDYNIRIRAVCGSKKSPWKRLDHPFNRRDTDLTAPEMTVTAVGGALQVTFDKLPFTAVVTVKVWKRGEEQQADVYKMPSEQKVLHVTALQEGAEYCVRAQTTLYPELHSSSTDAQCVSITGPGAAWMKPTTVTVTVIITAGLLFAVFWSVVHCRAESCRTYFQKEPLPPSLKNDWDIQIPMSPQEVELCEPIHMVSLDS